jgi:glycerol-3-phosphate dehydrogenase subunit C
MREQLGETDRNGKLAKPVAGLANWATSRKNKPVRALMEMVAGVDPDAELPKWHSKTAEDLCRTPAPANPHGPAFGKRRAVIYATCFADYNAPQTAVDAMAVLALQGVETRLVYPQCCGMPQLEAADLPEVASRAEKVSAELGKWIEDGWDVVALTASCGLMLKFEWPLILPEHEGVKKLAEVTKDVCQYVVEINKAHGLTPGLKPVEGGVTIHHACHARAQNMGAKSAEMLRLIPETKVDLIERCSGHGGTFGVMKQTYPVAMKVGRPAARQVAKTGDGELCSDCPLACKHLGQLLETELAGGPQPRQSHPIQVFARAYGL